MNPNLKKRIESINKGIIPEGYKKTKVGIVPVEWENMKFSDIFTEKSIRTSDFEKYPLYSLTIEEGVVPKSERYERSHLVKKDDVFKIVSENDYVYNPMNVRFGALARYKGKNPVSVSGYYDVFYVNDNYSMEYMDNFLLSAPMINYYNVVSTGSLKEKQRVHFSQFIEFNLPIPPLPEQQKIAEILGAQDKLIELQERKINQLKTLKKAYLQKMFPKKGSKYPELRFKGFTDTWEQRELGEYIIEHTEVTTHNNQYPVLTSSRKGIFLQSDYYNKQIASEDNTGYNIVPYGYFTYRHMSDDEIFYFNINDIVENGIVSTLYPVFTTTKDLDSRYLQYQLNYGSEFSNFAILQKQGGSRTYMYLSKLKKLKLTKPVSIEEQKQISDYFRTLDNLITLHQRKLDEEKQKKKALMQLLLTGKVRVKA